MPPPRQPSRRFTAQRRYTVGIVHLPFLPLLPAVCFSPVRLCIAVGVLSFSSSLPTFLPLLLDINFYPWPLSSSSSLPLLPFCPSLPCAAAAVLRLPACLPAFVTSASRAPRRSSPQTHGTWPRCPPPWSTPGATASTGYASATLVRPRRRGCFFCILLHRRGTIIIP